MTSPESRLLMLSRTSTMSVGFESHCCAFIYSAALNEEVKMADLSLTSVLFLPIQPMAYRIDVNLVTYTLDSASLMVSYVADLETDDSCMWLRRR